MGWGNCHLYEFRIDKLRCGPDLDSRYEIGCVDSHTVRLSDIVPHAKSRKKFKMMYLYDFGDDWVHEIVLEHTQPPEPKVKYPQCVAGERACPPEDCGGPYRYWDLLEAIRNRRHPDRRDWIDFVGPRFDPKKFDAQKATAAMRKMYSSYPW